MNTSAMRCACWPGRCPAVKRSGGQRSAAGRYKRQLIRRLIPPPWTMPRSGSRFRPRRTAAPPARRRRAADPGTPAGQVAQAVFWSGGSLSLPGLPVVPPPEHLLPTAVSVAAILAGLRPGPKLTKPTYERFVALAEEIAQGKNRWKEERPSPVAARPAPAAGVRPTPRRT